MPQPRYRVALGAPVKGAAARIRADSSYRPWGGIRREETRVDSDAWASTRSLRARRRADVVRGRGGCRLGRRRRVQPVRQSAGRSDLRQRDPAPDQPVDLAAGHSPTRQQRAARLERDQPQRPVSGRAGLERVLRQPDDLQPDQQHDRQADRSRYRPAEPTPRTSPSAPTARSSPRTAALSGFRSRRSSTSSASTSRPAPPPRRLRSRSAARSHHAAVQPEYRSERLDRRLVAGGHGALDRRQRPVRRAQRRQHARRDQYPDEHADQVDSGGERPPPGRLGRQRQCRLRVQRGGPSGHERRLHQPVRRNTGRVEQEDGWSHHRHRLGRRPHDRQGDRGDPGRAPADGSLPKRDGSARRQLERRQSVGHRRERQQRRPDRAYQPGSGRQCRQLRQRDQHVGSEPRAGQHRTRQRDRRVPVPRPLQAA